MPLSFATDSLPGVFGRRLGFTPTNPSNRPSRSLACFRPILLKNSLAEKPLRKVSHES